MDWLECLDDTTWAHVLKFLALRDVCTLAQTSRMGRQIAHLRQETVEFVSSPEALQLMLTRKAWPYIRFKEFKFTQESHHRLNKLLNLEAFSKQVLDRVDMGLWYQGTDAHKLPQYLMERLTHYTLEYTPGIGSHFFSSSMTALTCLEVTESLQWDMSFSVLAVLKNLRHLALEKCIIRDTTSLAQLSQLESFVATSCSSYGIGGITVPAELARLPSLRSVRILCQVDNCHLPSISFPDCLKALKLEEFEVQAGYFLSDVHEIAITALSLKRFLGPQLPELNDNLRSLHIIDCYGLHDLSSMQALYRLQRLILQNCMAVTNLPDPSMWQDLKELELNKCGVVELPNEIGHLEALQSMVLHKCARLKELPESLGNLKSLESLRLGECKRLQKVPDIITTLPLRSLSIRQCNKVKPLPSGIGHMAQLKELTLSGFGEGVSIFGSSEGPEGSTRLARLRIAQSHTITTNDLEQRFLRFPDLVQLEIASTCLVRDLTPIGKLARLRHLSIRGCRIQDLPDMKALGALSSFEIAHCPLLKSITSSLGQIQSLSKLTIENCPEVTELPSEICNLTSILELKIASMPKLETLPDNFGNMSNLSILTVSDCAKLSSFPDGFTELSSLHTLLLKGVYLEATLCVQGLASLRNLRIVNSTVPQSFDGLINLDVLSISQCPRLWSLSENVSGLQELRKLEILECWEFTHLPRNMKKLTKLEYLTVDSPKLSSISCLAGMHSLLSITIKFASLTLRKDAQWLRKMPDTTWLTYAAPPGRIGHQNLANRV